MTAANGTAGQEQHNTAQTAETAVETPTIEQIVWAFLKCYYQTLSSNKEKLHLFHNSPSQLVHGNEADKTKVYVGRAAIKEFIESLDFQDCKFCVTNVDCQSCGDDKIVAQVIGEMCSKNIAEPKKFAHTFVLAPQPNGYYVLNDIFRYLVDDVYEEVATEAPAAVEDAPAPADDNVVKAAVAEQPAPEVTAEETPIDPEVIEKKLEEDTEPAVLKAAETNGEAENAPVQAEEEKTSVPEQAETPAEAEKEIMEETLVPEAPKDPSPTPIPAKITSPTKPAPVVPATPAKPMSWASRAAAAAVAMPRPAVPAVPAVPVVPVVPAQKAATSARAPAAVAAPASKASEPTAAIVNKENVTPQSEGWQTAGADAKKQTRPQQQNAPAEKEGTMAYIPNVSEKVSAEELRAVLTAFGPLPYLDINRAKNCAFAEWATPAGYQAAYSANPHKVDGEIIRVEPRRPKVQTYGGGNFRGGMNNRGRGGFDNRGPGGQRGGRGNFGGAPRGGAPRGGARGPAPAGPTPTSA